MFMSPQVAEVRHSWRSVFRTISRLNFKGLYAGIPLVQKHKRKKYTRPRKETIWVHESRIPRCNLKPIPYIEKYEGLRDQKHLCPIKSNRQKQNMNRNYMFPCPLSQAYFTQAYSKLWKFLPQFSRDWFPNDNNRHFYVLSGVRGKRD
jgi:hypothetical protein